MNQPFDYKASVNQPKVSDNYEPPVAIYLMTEDFYQTFSNKHPLTELRDYSKVRSVCSIQDLAFIRAFEHLFLDRLRKAMPELGEYWCIENIAHPHDGLYVPATHKPATEDEVLEFRTSVLPLAMTPDMQNAAAAYLDGQVRENEVACESATHSIEAKKFIYDETTSPYKIVSLDDRLLIIVREGFSTQVKDQNLLLGFYRQVLKALLGTLPVPRVNSMTWYRAYLQAMAA